MKDLEAGICAVIVITLADEGIVTSHEKQWFVEEEENPCPPPGRKKVGVQLGTLQGLQWGSGQR